MTSSRTHRITHHVVETQIDDHSTFPHILFRLLCIVYSRLLQGLSFLIHLHLLSRQCSCSVPLLALRVAFPLSSPFSGSLFRPGSKQLRLPVSCVSPASISNLTLRLAFFIWFLDIPSGFAPGTKGDMRLRLVLGPASAPTFMKDSSSAGSIM